MENFAFRWREPGTESRNASMASTGNPGAYESYMAAAGKAGANTSVEADELDREIESIRRKIASLELERENLHAGRVSRDEMDRRLAANRARVSDFGNARAHLADIDARAQRAETWRQQKEFRSMDEAKAAKNAIKDYMNRIDALNNALSYGADNRAFAADKQAYDRLVSELASEYGVPYDPFGKKAPETPRGNTWEVPDTIEGWKIFELQHKDKKTGRWENGAKEFAIANIPQNTEEGAAMVKRISTELTVDEGDQKDAEAKTRAYEAIDEVMSRFGAMSVGKDIKASNGLTVKIEKLANGDIRYSVGKVHKDTKG